MSTPKVGLTARWDTSVDVQHADFVSCACLDESNLLVRWTRYVDIQHAVIKDRAVLFASSGEGTTHLLCRCYGLGDC